MRAVGWSFFGMRKNSGYQDDLAKLNPLHIIAVAFVAVALFVVALILLVRWVVAPEATQPTENSNREKKART